MAAKRLSITYRDGPAAPSLIYRDRLHHSPDDSNSVTFRRK